MEEQYLIDLEQLQAENASEDEINLVKEEYRTQGVDVDNVGKTQPVQTEDAPVQENKEDTPLASSGDSSDTQPAGHTIVDGVTYDENGIEVYGTNEFVSDDAKPVLSKDAQQAKDFEVQDLAFKNSVGQKKGEYQQELASNSEVLKKFNTDFDQIYETNISEIARELKEKYPNHSTDVDQMQALKSEFKSRYNELYVGAIEIDPEVNEEYKKIQDQSNEQFQGEVDQYLQDRDVKLDELGSDKFSNNLLYQVGEHFLEKDYLGSTETIGGVLKNLAIAADNTGFVGNNKQDQDFINIFNDRRTRIEEQFQEGIMPENIYKERVKKVEQKIADREAIQLNRLYELDLSNKIKYSSYEGTSDPDNPFYDDGLNNVLLASQQLLNMAPAFFSRLAKKGVGKAGAPGKVASVAIDMVAAALYANQLSYEMGDTVYRALAAKQNGIQERQVTVEMMSNSMASTEGLRVAKQIRVGDIGAGFLALKFDQMTFGAGKLVASPLKKLFSVPAVKKLVLTRSTKLLSSRTGRIVKSVSNAVLGVKVNQELEATEESLQQLTGDVIAERVREGVNNFSEFTDYAHEKYFSNQYKHIRDITRKSTLVIGGVSAAISTSLDIKNELQGFNKERVVTDKMLKVASLDGVEFTDFTENMKNSLDEVRYNENSTEEEIKEAEDTYKQLLDVQEAYYGLTNYPQISGRSKGKAMQLLTERAQLQRQINVSENNGLSESFKERRKVIDERLNRMQVSSKSKTTPLLEKIRGLVGPKRSVGAARKSNLPQRFIDRVEDVIQYAPSLEEAISRLQPLKDEIGMSDSNFEDTIKDLQESYKNVGEVSLYESLQARETDELNQRDGIQSTPKEIKKPVDERPGFVGEEGPIAITQQQRIEEFYHDQSLPVPEDIAGRFEEGYAGAPIQLAPDFEGVYSAEQAANALIEFDVQNVELRRLALEHASTSENISNRSNAAQDIRNQAWIPGRIKKQTKAVSSAQKQIAKAGKYETRKHILDQFEEFTGVFNLVDQSVIQWINSKTVNDLKVQQKRSRVSQSLGAWDQVIDDTQQLADKVSRGGRDAETLKVYQRELSDRVRTLKALYAIGLENVEASVAQQGAINGKYPPYFNAHNGKFEFIFNNGYGTKQIHDLFPAQGKEVFENLSPKDWGDLLVKVGVWEGKNDGSAKDNAKKRLDEYVIKTYAKGINGNEKQISEHAAKEQEEISRALKVLNQNNLVEENKTTQAKEIPAKKIDEISDTYEDNGFVVGHPDETINPDVKRGGDELRRIRRLFSSIEEFKNDSNQVDLEKASTIIFDNKQLFSSIDEWAKAIRVVYQQSSFYFAEPSTKRRFNDFLKEYGSYVMFDFELEGLEKIKALNSPGKIIAFRGGGSRTGVYEEKGIVKSELGFPTSWTVHKAWAEHFTDEGKGFLQSVELPTSAVLSYWNTSAENGQENELILDIETKTSELGEGLVTEVKDDGVRTVNAAEPSIISEIDTERTSAKGANFEGESLYDQEIAARKGDATKYVTTSTDKLKEVHKDRAIKRWQVASKDKRVQLEGDILHTLFVAGGAQILTDQQKQALSKGDPFGFAETFDNPANATTEERAVSKKRDELYKQLSAIERVNGWNYIDEMYNKHTEITEQIDNLEHEQITYDTEATLEEESTVGERLRNRLVDYIELVGEERALVFFNKMKGIEYEQDIVTKAQNGNEVAMRSLVNSIDGWLNIITQEFAPQYTSQENTSFGLYRERGSFNQVHSDGSVYSSWDSIDLHGASSADLMSKARELTEKAVYQYDPAKSKFITYATKVVRAGLAAHVKGEGINWAPIDRTIEANKSRATLELLQQIYYTDVFGTDNTVIGEETNEGKLNKGQLEFIRDVQKDKVKQDQAITTNKIVETKALIKLADPDTKIRLEGKLNLLENRLETLKNGEKLSSTLPTVVDDFNNAAGWTVGSNEYNTIAYSNLLMSGDKNLLPQLGKAITLPTVPSEITMQQYKGAAATLAVSNRGLEQIEEQIDGNSFNVKNMVLARDLKEGINETQLSEVERAQNITKQLQQSKIRFKQDQLQSANILAAVELGKTDVIGLEGKQETQKLLANPGNNTATYSNGLALKDGTVVPVRAQNTEVQLKDTMLEISGAKTLTTAATHKMQDISNDIQQKADDIANKLSAQERLIEAIRSAEYSTNLGLETLTDQHDEGYGTGSDYNTNDLGPQWDSNEGAYMMDGQVVGDVAQDVLNVDAAGYNFSDQGEIEGSSSSEGRVIPRYITMMFGDIPASLAYKSQMHEQQGNLYNSYAVEGLEYGIEDGLGWIIDGELVHEGTLVSVDLGVLLDAVETVKTPEGNTVETDTYGAEGTANRNEIPLDFANKFIKGLSRIEKVQSVVEEINVVSGDMAIQLAALNDGDIKGLDAQLYNESKTKFLQLTDELQKSNVDQELTNLAIDLQDSIRHLEEQNIPALTTGKSLQISTKGEMVIVNSKPSIVIKGEKTVERKGIFQDSKIETETGAERGAAQEIFGESVLDNDENARDTAAKSEYEILEETRDNSIGDQINSSINVDIRFKARQAVPAREAIEKLRTLVNEVGLAVNPAIPGLKRKLADVNQEIMQQQSGISVANNRTEDIIIARIELLMKQRETIQASLDAITPVNSGLHRRLIEIFKGGVKGRDIPSHTPYAGMLKLMRNSYSKLSETNTQTNDDRPVERGNLAKKITSIFSQLDQEKNLDFQELEGELSQLYDEAFRETKSTTVKDDTIIVRELIDQSKIIDDALNTIPPNTLDVDANIVKNLTRELDEESKTLDIIGTKGEVVGKGKTKYRPGAKDYRAMFLLEQNKDHLVDKYGKDNYLILVRNAFTTLSDQESTKDSQTAKKSFNRIVDQFTSEEIVSSYLPSEAALYNELIKNVDTEGNLWVTRGVVEYNEDSKLSDKGYSWTFNTATSKEFATKTDDKLRIGDNPTIIAVKAKPEQLIFSNIRGEYEAILTPETDRLDLVAYPLVDFQTMEEAINTNVEQNKNSEDNCKF